MACDDRPIVFLDCVKHTGEEEEEKSIKAGRGRQSRRHASTLGIIQDDWRPTSDVTAILIYNLFWWTPIGFAGTPGYLSPEVLKKEPYGKPVDIWACGKFFRQHFAVIFFSPHAIFGPFFFKIRCHFVHFIGWIPSFLGRGPASIVRTDQSWSLWRNSLIDVCFVIWPNNKRVPFISIRRRNGTRWHRTPKIWSIKCWLSTPPSASRPPKPSNTHGSA